MQNPDARCVSIVSFVRVENNQEVRNACEGGIEVENKILDSASSHLAREDAKFQQYSLSCLPLNHFAGR